MHIRRKTLLLLASPFVLLLVAAYVQWAIAGLPSAPPNATVMPETATEPSGFPAWLRVTHYVNFLFIVLLVRSGLQILVDHPRLYWNVHCTPGTEWLRLTPVEVPKDRVWTAKDDSRYLSPWIGLPGYRHTIGMARHWHFLSVMFWVSNGLVFGILLFATGQWRRLAPDSWQVVPDAWAVFVHYATLHLPPEPNGFYHYNALQQLAYFGVVFILAPLAILTGPSMSPALTNRFPWYPRLPGNRQIGRSLHFLVMCAFVLFLVGHVAMVAITGFVRNMNHIVVGSDDTRLTGVYFGLVGVGVIVAVNVLANWLAWRQPRLVQHVAKALVTPVMGFMLDRHAPQAEFRRDEISPFVWANGKAPTCEEWKALAANNFKDYRLKVYGLVENPVELSLEDLRGLTKKAQITLHHCIQGWSGIAAWSGLPLAELIRLVRPRPDAKAVVFYSFGEGVALHEGVVGVQYYDNLSIENALNPQALLAYEMNYRPLNHLHGAPLRLRVENQLGFKMVKWIQTIQFVESVRSIGKGEGGFAEDHEYFGELANI
ncbi:MAG TPA: molybdopterin-dependent oxidoreductase [Pirellulales bacterium]|jgi:DMSO/TMAO reductase YedYZ molybdopterin-dependent catalytic subunit/thiosulfate reductase cytochrome b subunit|nr:molybdopterin-dependent oxidoreductase [Pirellulales bacterium]